MGVDWVFLGRRTWAFIRHRMDVNRSPRRRRLDIEILRLTKEEQEAVFDLEHVGLLKKAELDYFIRWYQRPLTQEPAPEPTPLDVWQQIKKIRDDMKDALKDVIDLEEAEQIRAVFKAKINSLLHGRW